MDLGSIVSDLAHDIYFDYGVVILLTVIVTVLVVPGLVKKGAPSLIKSWTEDAEVTRTIRLQAVELERERVGEMKKIADATASIAVTLARFDVRLDHLEKKIDHIQDRHDTILNGAR